MSTQTSPTHLPPPPYPLNTPSSHIPLSSTPSFTDAHAFSHIDIKDEDILDVTRTPSASTSTAAVTPIDTGPHLPQASQMVATPITAISGTHSMDGLGVTIGSQASGSKGKNGATGPAEGKSKPHLCHICNRGFTTGGHLQRHQRIHTGVKAFRCPFPGCETRTSRQDNLQQHYRTHLSPTLRKGDGSGARQAVNAAMEAAGMKAMSARAPRKSKASNPGTTPSSTSTSSASHLPSPYQTPTSQGPSPYTYMYDPNGYPAYPLPPPMPMMPHAPSTASSRVPSPVNGHPVSAGPGPGTLIPAHHQQFYPPPFPHYGYPAMPHYRHFPGINPYAPYHPMMPDQMFSPMPSAFATHSREGSYNGMMTPGYNPMANGYPPRTQTSTPISQTHDDLKSSHSATDLTLSGYGRASRPVSPLSTLNGNNHAAAPLPSPGSGPPTGLRQPPNLARRSPPPGDPMLAQGVVDPSNMHRPLPHFYAYPHPPLGGGGPHLGAFGYNTPQPTQQQSALSQRASVSSVSDGSGGGSGGGEDSQKGDAMTQSAASNSA